MTAGGTCDRGRVGEGGFGRKLLACLCSLVLAFSMWPCASIAGAAESLQADDGAALSTLASFGLTGSGTESDPYIIDSESDWAEFFDAINSDGDGSYRSASYQLACDIDLESSELGDDYQSPIAPSEDYAFTGTFDGGGHTVSNLAIKGKSHQGLFGYVEGATIEDLTVTGSVIGTCYVGGIVGYAEDSSLFKLINEASVSSSSIGEGGVGGIVGEANNSSLSDCSNTGSVTADWFSADSSVTQGYNLVGGLVGYFNVSESGVSIDCCYNTGDVSGWARKLGGIAGEVSSSSSDYEISITNCYNRGDVAFTGSASSSTYRSYCGGIIGYVAENWSCVVLENCYSSGGIASNNTKYCSLAALCGRAGKSSAVSLDKISNNYYLEGSADYGICSSATSSSNYHVSSSEGQVETRTETEFKTAGMAAELGENYADDTGDTQYNEGWPYLLWQNPSSTFSASINVSLANENNESAENLISIVICDAEGNDVTSSFTAASDNSSTQASWSLGGLEEGESLSFSYTVSKTGYETVEGSFTVKASNVSEDIVLQPTAYSYTLIVSPSDADVEFLVDGEAVEAEEKDVDKDAGTATYVYGDVYNSSVLSCSVSREDYIGQSFQIGSLSFDDGIGAVTLLRDIAAADIALESDSFTYTGEAIEPSLNITFEDEELVLGEDYTVAYSDNVDVGTATATITGIGACSGTASISFTITAISLDDATLTLDAESYSYTGKAIEPDLSVTVDGLVLVEDEDYTVEYADNVEAGTATISITGIGNYSGTITATFEITELQAELFTDVQDEDSYYYDAVYVLSDAGYISGYEGGELFGVGDGMTRVQVVNILYRMAGSPDASYAEGTFGDVSADKYYAEAVAWAAEEGVTTGTEEGDFLPNDTITRQEMFVMVARYLCGGTDVEAIDSATILSYFRDSSEISSYAKEAVAWCIEQQLVTGTDEGDINPQDELSREAGATVLYRGMDQILALAEE